MSLARITNTLLLLVAAISTTTSALAQSSSDIADSANPKVVMHTSMGNMTIELDAENAPGTVDNFLQYVDDEYYSGTVFHRVIEGFMIQGGGFTAALEKKDTRAPVSNEAYNGLSNRKYSIAMARTNAPHSATSQFFINSEDNRNLDHKDTSPRGWGYTVFGRVIAGEQVVDAISRVKTGRGGRFSKDVPVETIVISSVERLGAATEEATKTAEPLAAPADDVPASAADKVIQDAQKLTSPSELIINQPKTDSPDAGIIKQN